MTLYTPMWQCHSKTQLCYNFSLIWFLVFFQFGVLVGVSFFLCCHCAELVLASFSFFVVGCRILVLPRLYWYVDWRDVQASFFFFLFFCLLPLSCPGRESLLKITPLFMSLMIKFSIVLDDSMLSIVHCILFLFLIKHLFQQQKIIQVVFLMSFNLEKKKKTTVVVHFLKTNFQSPTYKYFRALRRCKSIPNHKKMVSFQKKTWSPFLHMQPTPIMSSFHFF